MSEKKAAAKKKVSFSEKEAMFGKEAMSEKKKTMSEKEAVAEKKMSEKEAVAEKKEATSEKEAVAEKKMSEKEAVAEKKETMSEKEATSEKEAEAEKKRTMSEKEAISEMKTMSEKVALPEKEAMSEKEAVFEKEAVSEKDAVSEEEAEAPRQLTLAELVETDFLRCPQCRQHFTSPTLLPCLHAFCAACLAALPSHPLTDGALPSHPLTDGALPSHPLTNGALPSRPLTNGPRAKLLQLQCPLCRASVTVPEAPNPAQAPTAFLQALCELRATKHGAAERSCSYCQFDGKSEAAGWRCLDCSDDLCEPCARAHRKTRLTRDHLVAPYAQIRNGLYDHDIRARQLPRCPRPHPQQGGQPLARFCCDCLQLTCRGCEAESHRGHRLEPAEDAVDRLRPEAQSFVRGLRKRIPALAEYRAFLRRQLEKLEARRTAVEGGVQRQAEAVHALVDLHRDSLLEDVAAAFGKEAADIESRCADLGVAQRSLESNAQLLGNLLAVGSAPEVLQLHPAVMARLKQLIHMQPSTLAQRLAPRFHAGPATAQNMRIMFGTVELRRVPVEHGEGGEEEEEEEEAVPPKARLSVSTLLPEPLDPPRLLCTLPLKLEDEAKEVWPSGLHVRKGILAVVDRDNRKVKIFDCTSAPPRLKFQFSGKAEHRLVSPFDAVLLENGVVVVTDHGAEKVKVFDVTGRWIGDLAGEFRHPRGIAVSGEGQLVVVDGLLLQLSVHHPDTGKLLRTIPATDSDGHKLLVDPFYVAVTERGDLVVTDHAAPNIKVFSSEGQHLADYGTYGTSASEVLKPYGVCVDRYGQLLVADSDNHRVHLLLPDGTFSRFLLTHHHKLAHPVTLAINDEGHLVVSEAFGNMKIFKYL